MPWRETQVVEERVQFVQEWHRGGWTMTELCGEFGISRKTGYKYLRRYEERGLDGLHDESRAPHRPGRAVDEKMRSRILVLKRREPTWGARKIRDRLILDGEDESPAESTIHRILDESGLVRRRKRRRRAVPSEEPLCHARQPNDVWCADFKGWFRTGDGQRCDPFTVTDACSRYCLCCRGVERPDFPSVQKALIGVFREYGLPWCFRSDNGSPFASCSIAGLCQLAIWLIQLGIRIERIEPGAPQQNGRHERFHWTLKEDTASPPAATLRAQQRRFTSFQEKYNHYRPHEALDGATPGSIYVASNREYSSVRRELEYPGGFELRTVHANGIVKIKGVAYFVSEVLRGELIGVRQESERRWRLRYGPVELGWVDTASQVITPYKRLRYAEDEQ